MSEKEQRIDHVKSLAEIVIQAGTIPTWERAAELHTCNEELSIKEGMMLALLQLLDEEKKKNSQLRERMEDLITEFENKKSIYVFGPGVENGDLRQL